MNVLSSWRRLPLAGKIVLPYLLLTLLVGVGGTYVATRLVARSANDRLATALVEAVRRADAQLAEQEATRLAALDALAGRPGLVEAVAGGRGLEPGSRPAGVDWA